MNVRLSGLFSGGATCCAAAMLTFLAHRQADLFATRWCGRQPHTQTEHQSKAAADADGCDRRTVRLGYCPHVFCCLQSLGAPGIQARTLARDSDGGGGVAGGCLSLDSLSSQFGDDAGVDDQSALPSVDAAQGGASNDQSAEVEPDAEPLFEGGGNGGEVDAADARSDAGAGNRRRERCERRRCAR